MELAGAAPEIVTMMNEAEIAIANDDSDLAVDRMVDIAERVFEVAVFSPETSLDNWQAVLEQ
jgi:hypothetical protein